MSKVNFVPVVLKFQTGNSSVRVTQDVFISGKTLIVLDSEVRDLRISLDGGPEFIARPGTKIKTPFERFSVSAYRGELDFFGSVVEVLVSEDSVDYDYTQRQFARFKKVIFEDQFDEENVALIASANPLRRSLWVFTDGLSMVLYPKNPDLYGDVTLQTVPSGVMTQIQNWSGDVWAYCNGYVQVLESW